MIITDTGKVTCTLDEWITNGPSICRHRDVTVDDLVITDKEPMWHFSGTTKATHFWPEPGKETNLVTYQYKGKCVPPDMPSKMLLAQHDLPQSIYDGLTVRWYRSKEEGKTTLSRYLIEWANQQS